MKYTVEGFNQKKLVEYKLDIIDAAILRYFIDFRDSGSMISKVIQDKQYHWIRYESIASAMPILNLKKSDSVYRRLKKMVEANILESTTVRQGGVYSFYRTGPNYLSLISDDKLLQYSDENPKFADINPNTSDENPKSTDFNPNISDKNPEQNINLLYSSINNSSINNIYSEIIDFLNSKAGTKYRKDNKKTISLIEAKLKDGFTIQDFKKVIHNKCLEWKGTKMAAYLRPETLFGSKFEGYLNQKVVNNNKVNSNGKLSNFNNFDQRDYDFDELEKKLLSNSSGEGCVEDPKVLLEKLRTGS